MTRKVLRKIIKIGKDFPIEIYDDLVVDYDEKLAQGKTGALVQGVEPCMN